MSEHRNPQPALSETGGARIGGWARASAIVCALLGLATGLRRRLALGLLGGSPYYLDRRRRA